MEKEEFEGEFEDYKNAFNYVWIVGISNNVQIKADSYLIENDIVYLYWKNEYVGKINLDFIKFLG